MEFDWEVLEDGLVVAKFNAQLRAATYAEAESKQYPYHHYLIRHAGNPEGERSAIVLAGRTYLRHG
jgi:hypothetical protein